MSNETEMKAAEGVSTETLIKDFTLAQAKAIGSQEVPEHLLTPEVAALLKATNALLARAKLQNGRL